MKDIKEILKNPESFNDSVLKRNIKSIDIYALVKLYKEYIKIKKEIEEVRSELNLIANSIKKLSGAEKTEAISKATGLKGSLKLLEENFKTVEENYLNQMMFVPNDLPDDTPEGFEEDNNLEIKKIGTPRKFDFKSLNHLEVGSKLDIIDFDSATKTTGAKFYFLKNDALILEMALKSFAVNLLKQKGFLLLKTPDLAKKEVLIGSGFNPRGNESNIYNIEDTDMSLVATAEITVGGFLSNTVFKGEVLPLKFAAESHCFRREAGGAGRENRGLYRVHQFDKIEMYVVSTPEKSNEILEELLGIEEEIYQKLELPYRVLRICAGDLGAPAYKKYDIEAWMPSKGLNGEYGEVTSTSNCTNFQARRLNIKFKGQDGAKKFAHTLNGTAVATSRVILAILENYQQEDGSVLIPKVLQPYTGFDKIAIPARPFDSFKDKE